MSIKGDTVSFRMNRPTGFTLTELLVASTIALTVMGALATLFGVFSGTVRRAEAIVALTDTLRTTAARLRLDLSGATVDPSRICSPESGTGYFEYIEGPRKDWNAGAAVADIDDVLMFTARSPGNPFVGRFTVPNGNSFEPASFESPFAEIAWFCKESPAVEQTIPGVVVHRLYRRQLLSTAYIGREPFTTPGSHNVLSNSVLGPNFATVYLNFDFSLRNIGSTAIPIFATNSLADLTRRENRFLHGGAFPFPFAGQTSSNATFDGTIREGEDILMNNVISFDVRIFDPEAPWHCNNGTLLQPGDPGYPVTTGTAVATVSALSAAGSATMAQVRDTGDFYGRIDSAWALLPRGAYVDLAWGLQTAAVAGAPNGRFDIEPKNTSPGFDNRFPGSEDVNKNNQFDSPTEDLNLNGRLDTYTAFQGLGMNVSRTAALALPTYDTWSAHYECNGFDEGGTGVDEGADGLDSNADGFVDESSESETSAPYPVPLRGLEVRIRCIDPLSKQIRQISIRHSFSRP